MLNCSMVLEAGQCYSFKHPIVLGGDLAPENTEVSDFAVCNSFASQILQQTANLPEGARINTIMKHE